MFWYLAAGAALFLNQYPRMDEIHWLWSSGLLLLCGAVVLHAWYRHALHLAPALARSSLGRAAFGGSLLLLPAFGVFPHVWARLNYWPALVPASPDDVHAATVGARSNPTPLTMPDGHADVWIPGEDHAAIAEVVQLLDEKTTPGEPIFTYPAIPGFYFLADRPNPTRFNHLFNGMASPRDQQQIVQQLEQVRYVVWDDGGAHYWVKPGDNAPVTEYIRTHYRVERFIGPYAVLSRDAAGPPLTYFAPAKPAAQSSL